MQFKLTSVVTFLALALTAVQGETQQKDAKVEVAGTDQMSKVNTLSKAEDAFSTTEARTYGIQDGLVGDVFNGIYNRCGGNRCNNFQYYGPQYGGYYSIYYPYTYYQYNWDGSYTVYLYNFNGYGYSNTIAITCYNNRFYFTPYNQGYLYRVPQNSRCVVRYI